MAVPRNRMSNARKNSKRSHHAPIAKLTIKCNGCGVTKLPHTICQACGAYGNGLVYTNNEQ